LIRCEERLKYIYYENLVMQNHDEVLKKEFEKVESFQEKMKNFYPKSLATFLENNIGSNPTQGKSLKSLKHQQALWNKL